MVSKQCTPSNSTANLGLRFCCNGRWWCWSSPDLLASGDDGQFPCLPLFLPPASTDTNPAAWRLEEASTAAGTGGDPDPCCGCCGWILEAPGAHDRLTFWPKDSAQRASKELNNDINMTLIMLSSFFLLSFLPFSFGARLIISWGIPGRERVERERESFD